jgi:hypothetical protein
MNVLDANVNAYERDFARSIAALIAARAWGLFFQQVEPTMAEALETMSSALALLKCANEL